MLFDILFVFVVSLLSSLCFCTSSVHGLPTSSSASFSSSPSSSIDHYLYRHPSVAAAAAAVVAADPTSSLRLFRHQPVPKIDSDLGGDISEMLLGESNELSSMATDDDNDDGDDDDTVIADLSSLDRSSDSLNNYIHPLSSKFFLTTAKHLQDAKNKQEEKKRSIPPVGPFNLKSTLPTDPLNSNSMSNINRLSESTRLSPSLQNLVETNPFARAWLAMLLQKVMEEQPVPYIFKYGRRRK